VSAEFLENEACGGLLVKEILFGDQGKDRKEFETTEVQDSASFTVSDLRATARLSA
jgi:hypothetical protein